MKKLEKMSLANVKGKLSRKEMKNILGGGSGATCASCNHGRDCATGFCAENYPPCSVGTYNSTVKYCM